MFPLLVKKFSLVEQASLVWQFLYSAPIMHLEEMIQWMISFLSREEWDHVILCLKDVVPKEEPLQEVGLNYNLY